VQGTARRVLEESTLLFAARGFHGTSMRDIGAAVGIKAASVYEHFASKDEILAALTTVGHEHIRDQVHAALADVGDDPATQLSTYVRTCVVTMGEWPKLAMVANDDLRSLPAELAKRPTAARDELGLLLIDILRRGIDAGQFEDRNIILVSAAVGGIIIRTPYWFTPTKAHTVADLAADYADLVVAMVGRPPTTRRRRKTAT